MKYTDEQIKRAKSHFKYGIDCDIFSEPVLTYAKIALDALDLINRQKVEIERLTAENEQLGNDVDGKLKYIYELEAEIERLQHDTAEFPNRVLCSKGLILTRSLAEYDELINEIASEAIKEFWGELKRRNTLDYGIVSAIAGDNLVKEMVGE